MAHEHRAQEKRALASRQEACELAAQGRHLEAIEALTAANRLRHDDENEVLLTRLRHQASRNSVNRAKDAMAAGHR